MCVADFPELLIVKEWNLTYLPPEPEQTDDELKTQAAQTYHGLKGDQTLLQTDQVILATVFGQIKIIGKWTGHYRNWRAIRLCCMERMYRLLWNWDKEEPPYNISIMRRDLERFVNRVVDCTYTVCSRVIRYVGKRPYLVNWNWAEEII